MSSLQALRGNGDALVFGVLALAGLAAMATGASYGVTLDGGRVGPGFLPVVAGGLTAVLCGWIAARGVLPPKRSGPEPALGPPLAALADFPAATDGHAEGEYSAGPPDDDLDITGRTQRERTRNLWRVFALTLAAILLVKLIGFLAAFSLLILVISTWTERQPLMRSLAIAALGGVVVYLVFGVFLGVPLPGGLLGLGTEG